MLRGYRAPRTGRSTGALASPLVTAPGPRQSQPDRSRSSLLDLPATILAIGAVLALDPAGWYRFAPAKWLIVLLCSIAVLLVRLFDARLRHIGGERRRAPRSVLVAMAAFVAWLAVCAWQGADPTYAWWGTPERHAGWVLWLVCAVLVWAAAPIRAVISGLQVAGAVLLPVLVIEAFGSSLADNGSERLTGVFGSAAYLGAASCLILPASAWPLWVSIRSGARNRSHLWLPAAGTAGGWLALLGSGTRGAWLAVAAAGSVCALASIRRGTRQVPRRRSSTPAMANAPTLMSVVGLVALTVFALLTTPLSSRAGGSFDGRAAGGASRVDEWRVGIRTLGDRPWLGAGPEGYRIVFSDGVDERYEAEHGRDPQPDRAHNGLLDIGLIGGVPGATAYIGVIATIAVSARRRRRHSGWTAYETAAAVAVTMYLVQQQFLFPLAELEPVAAMLAGGLVACRDGSGPAGRLPDGARPAERAGRTGVVRGAVVPVVAVRAVATTLCVAVMVTAAVRTMDELRDDRVAADAVELAARNQRDAAFQRVAAAGLFGDSAMVRVHLLRASLAPTEADAAAAFDDALRISPGDPIALLQWASFLTATDPARARIEVAALIDNDPLNAQLHLLAGVAALSVGDEAVGETSLLRALELSPTSAGPRQNLIRLYRQQGRDDDAQQLEDQLTAG
jgi:O-antigen ligase/Tfp pilus assembly protein PilF